MAGIRPQDVSAQFACVPCETYSIAGYSNESRGNHYRMHDLSTKPPRKDGSQKGRMAATHDKLVQNILHAWLCDRDRGSKQVVFMENPVGFLSRRPFVQRYSSLLGLTRRTVHYCAYGHIFNKPTHIWTNARSWKPTGKTGDGLCGGKCDMGRMMKSGRYKHYHGLAQEPIRGPRGAGALKLKNAVPAPLCEEWIQHLKSAPKGSCVIDLCAGYQSLKPHALAHGFSYIAVDLRGDRNTWPPVERTGGCQILR